MPPNAACLLDSMDGTRNNPAEDIPTRVRNTRRETFSSKNFVIVPVASAWIVAGSSQFQRAPNAQFQTPQFSKASHSAENGIPWVYSLLLHIWYHHMTMVRTKRHAPALSPFVFTMLLPQHKCPHDPVHVDIAAYYREWPCCQKDLRKSQGKFQQKPTRFPQETTSAEPIPSFLPLDHRICQ